MKSIYTIADRESIIERIMQLSASSQSKWGKMNVAQMLKHCQQPIKVALGELVLPKTLSGILFGKIMKKKLLKTANFKKNLPTDKKFTIIENADFEAEKVNLIEIINKFDTIDMIALSKRVHPFFGKMKPEEWGILSYNHLDHHLRQFGV
jgi:Protein of unknown function (DUF1569)